MAITASLIDRYFLSSRYFLQFVWMTRADSTCNRSLLRALIPRTRACVQWILHLTQLILTCILTIPCFNRRNFLLVEWVRYHRWMTTICFIIARWSSSSRINFSASLMKISTMPISFIPWGIMEPLSVHIGCFVSQWEDGPWWISWYLPFSNRFPYPEECDTAWRRPSVDWLGSDARLHNGMILQGTPFWLSIRPFVSSRSPTFPCIEADEGWCYRRSSLESVNFVDLPIQTTLLNLFIVGLDASNEIRSRIRQCLHQLSQWVLELFGDGRWFLRHWFVSTDHLFHWLKSNLVMHISK